jgi:hypothetical protein
MTLFSREILWLVLIAVAYLNNPTESDFNRYLERQLMRNGHGWLRRKILSQTTRFVYERKNYYLFSIFYTRDVFVDHHILGLFGQYIPISKRLFPHK